jgi:hypothetical protein
MIRRIFRQAIRTVQEGGDPPNTERDDFLIKVRAAAEFIPAPAEENPTAPQLARSIHRQEIAP